MLRKTSEQPSRLTVATLPACRCKHCYCATILFRRASITPSYSSPNPPAAPAAWLSRALTALAGSAAASFAASAAAATVLSRNLHSRTKTGAGKTTMRHVQVAGSTNLEVLGSSPITCCILCASPETQRT
eukprot:GHUV01039557.1.p1 GENE.GHUV01039557.1~~GHUV01039557.1.p1  ORF type:complete len:130 (+),score=0.29 GHUV01039557.1:418-807(+)